MELTDQVMFNGDELATNVWKSKYAQEEETHYDQMHKRLAKEFAKVELDYQLTEPLKNSDLKTHKDRIEKLSKYGRIRKNLDEETIYNLFKDFKYIVPQGSIMSQLGSKSIGSLSNCFRGDVKVLTRQGWMPIMNLSGSEHEIMTKGGQWVYAPFKSYGQQELLKVTLSNGFREKVLYATKGHRWALYKKSKPENVYKIKTTEELSVDDVLYSTYGKFRNFKPSAVGIAHGITYGDGHTVKGRDNANNITLCAESRVLSNYFPNSFISSDETLCEGGSDSYGGLPNYFRELPNINENKAYLYGWLAGYFAADGHIDNRGAVMINSSKEEDILFVIDVCGVLGIGCTEITSQEVKSNLTNKSHKMYKCFIHKNHLSEDFFLLEKHKNRFNKTDKENPARWKVVSIESTNTIETVYCAEVPETESFVIEGNILSMNCFVIGTPEDSYGGIFQKDQEMAQLMKRRGGVGLDISTLRPKDTLVSNAAKTTTGAVSFMHRFSNTTNEVAQNGRRGALMLSIDINHPDVMDFIKIKRDKTSVTGANISIKINDEFMEAVESDSDYLLRFPCDVYNRVNKSVQLLPTLEYNELTIIPEGLYTGITYVKKIKAKEYWDEIIKSAHGYAEPGIIFVDNHHNYSPDGAYPQFKGVTTNPCGEIFMQPYDACRLIALNLYSFVKNPFTKDVEFDSKKFYEITYEAMRLSDDLINLELEHIDRILEKISKDATETSRTELELWLNIRSTAEASRRTGLGFTALGDCLAALGYKYDSEEALLFIEQMMHIKMEAELDCTIDLAILRGPFKGWDKDLEKNTWYEFIKKSFPEQFKRMQQYSRRNVSFSTVAPTGTVSLLTQTTSGIEPIFSLHPYIRRKKINPNDKDVRVDFVDESGDSWQEYAVIHPKLIDYMKLFNITISLNVNTKEEQEELVKITKEFLDTHTTPWDDSTANDIDWIKRVEIQSIIQKYTTHSISSTINLPNSVSEQEVSEIYLESWKKGLKGITVYRDGSRSGVLVAATENKSRDEFNYVDAVKRPKQLDAEVHMTKVGGVPHYIIVGLLNNKPYEIFIENRELPTGKGTLIKQSKGNYKFVKEGFEKLVTSEMSDEQAAITRLTSTSLRHGTDIKFLVEQLNKCDGDLFSFTKGLARTLKKYIPDGVKSTVSCQDCGSTNVIFEEGCSSCKDCGASACS